jgi:hypothetical protein
VFFVELWREILLLRLASKRLETSQTCIHLVAAEKTRESAARCFLAQVTTEQTTSRR